MKSPQSWFMLAHIFPSGSRSAAHRLACRRLLRSCLWLLGVFALAGGLAQAAVIKEGDILVTDPNVDALIKVDPETGARTVVSDFGDPSQGPGNGGFPFGALGGIAVTGGQIFVTDFFVGIFAVDPRTGKRTLVTDITKGAIHGFLWYGMGAEVGGSVVVPLATTSLPTYVVRVDTRSDHRVLVTDFSNLTQGAAITCCYIQDLTVGPLGGIFVATENNAGGASGIYRINPITGKRTLVSDFTNGAQGTDVADFQFGTGIAIESSGQILVNSTPNFGTVTRTLLFRINPITGKRTVLSDFDDAKQGPLGFGLNGLAVEKSGRLVVGTGNATIQELAGTLVFRVNQLTGQRSLLSDGKNRTQGVLLKGIANIAVVPGDHDDHDGHSNHDDQGHRDGPGSNSKPTGDSLVSPFGVVK
ncbi:hypothetical protein AWB81_04230 [Caballeronia arationis]|uniref:hypothetical protein n=1 Tax=Caballeronia arationis TaxID=1777142 RepID=UPI00074BC34D|nr:hypothetical protein [Caballeronia arationis]SAK83684.1 hypothetical protein AWB81_04230 [Caballeronia arationis]